MWQALLGGLAPQFFKEMEWTSPFYNISEDKRERRALSMQARGIGTHFDTTMAMAKKHGLHPLFALGAAPSISPSYDSSYRPSGATFDFSGVGRGADRARERQLFDAQLEGLRLDNRTKQTQLDLLEAGTAMALAREATRSPVAAEAYTAARAHEQAVARAHQEAQTQFEGGMRVRTVPGMTIATPDGTEIPIPPGMAPQEVWETLIGDVAEIIGVNIGARMMARYGGMTLREFVQKAPKEAREEFKRRVEKGKRSLKELRKGLKRNW